MSAQGTEMRGGHLPDDLSRHVGRLFSAFAEPLFAWRAIGDGDFVLVAYNDAAARVPQANVAALLGQSAREVYGEVLPEVVDDLRASAKAGALARELDYVYRTSGAQRRLLVSYTLVAPDIVVVGTRDITDLWHTAEANRRRVRELEELIAFTLDLLESDGQQEARNAFCRIALDICDADAVYLLEPLDDELRQTAVARGPDMPIHEPLVVPLTPDVASYTVRAFRSGDFMFIADALDDPRVSRLMSTRFKLRSGFVMPVRSGADVLGVLNVGWRERRADPPESQLTLMRLLRRTPAQSSPGPTRLRASPHWPLGTRSPGFRTAAPGTSSSRWRWRTQHVHNRR